MAFPLTPFCRAAGIGLMLALVGVACPASAQQAPLPISPPAAESAPAAEPAPAAGQPAAPKLPDRAAREQELQKLRQEQQQAAENQAKLKAEIAAIGRDRQQLSRALIDTATRLRDLEARVTQAQDRVRSLDDNEQQIRAKLDGRRDVIAELLAALQRVGRRPPPALLVRPQDALAAVRTAILLGAVVPEMRAETEKLAADLAELVKVRRAIADERQRLADDLAGLTQDRQRMSALVDERQKRQGQAELALDAERRRAGTLARQTDSLQDLITKLDRAAAIAPGTPAAPPRDARLTPAIAFASAKGMLPLPVNGLRITAFGRPDGIGGTAKGSTIAARPGAQVTAPCDGLVRYAGPFRSYGQLLILDAGGGYHVLLAGMERISVDIGQFVLTGEPVAVMGGPKSAASEAAGSGQPSLYIEFRKDGTPIDPGPWWTATDSEKVRG